MSEEMVFGLSFPCVGVLDDGIFDLGIEDEGMALAPNRHSDFSVPQTQEEALSPDSLDVALLEFPSTATQSGDSNLSLSNSLHRDDHSIHLNDESVVLEARDLILRDLIAETSGFPFYSNTCLKPGDVLDGLDPIPCRQHDLTCGGGVVSATAPVFGGMLAKPSICDDDCSPSILSKVGKMTVRPRSLHGVPRSNNCVSGKTIESPPTEARHSDRRHHGDKDCYRTTQEGRVLTPNEVSSLKQSSSSRQTTANSNPTSSSTTSSSLQPESKDSVSADTHGLPFAEKSGRQIALLEMQCLKPQAQASSSHPIFSPHRTSSSRTGLSKIGCEQAMHSLIEKEERDKSEGGKGLEDEYEGERKEGRGDDNNTEEFIDQISGIHCTVARQLKCADELLKRRNFFYVDTTYRSHNLSGHAKARKGSWGGQGGKHFSGRHRKGLWMDNQGTTHSRINLAGLWSSAGGRKRTVGLHTIPGIKMHDPGWRCQDAMLAIAPFNRNDCQALFAVFDGHGPYGRQVAQGSMECLPKYLAAGICRGGVPQAFRRACQNLHRKMVSGMVGDCTHSGTTMCAVYLEGTRLTVANVGDSGCCRIRRLCAPSIHTEGREGECTETDSGRGRGGGNDGGRSSHSQQVVAERLTRDHKPHQKKELARIQASGGVVSPLPTNRSETERVRNLVEEGNEGGGNPTHSQDGTFHVPRVWLRSGEGPGLAMSRSIGDKVAHSVGVTHEPELTELELCGTTDLMLVLASDGVWDVLNLEDVRKIALPHLLNKNWSPGAISTDICERAHKKWGAITCRGSDDISCMVVKTSQILKQAFAKNVDTLPQL